MQSRTPIYKYDLKRKSKMCNTNEMKLWVNVHGLFRCVNLHGFDHVTHIVSNPNIHRNRYTD